MRRRLVPDSTTGSREKAPRQPGNPETGTGIRRIPCRRRTLRTDGLPVGHVAAGMDHHLPAMRPPADGAGLRAIPHQPGEGVPVHLQQLTGRHGAAVVVPLPPLAPVVQHIRVQRTDIEVPLLLGKLPAMLHTDGQQMVADGSGDEQVAADPLTQGRVPVQGAYPAVVQGKVPLVLVAVVGQARIQVEGTADAAVAA